MSRLWFSTASLSDRAGEAAALGAVVWRTGERSLKEWLPQDIQRAFDPSSAIDLLHDRAQKRL